MSLKKKSKQPVTRVALSRPKAGSAEWVIWAAWADRITFEEIEAETGLVESEVIRFMQKNQSPQTFRRWRKRVTGRKTKHRHAFETRYPNRWSQRHALENMEP